MTSKFMTSAVALTAALALGLPATAAFAIGGPDIDDSFNDNSTDIDVDLDDSLNDNSTNDSNNDNSTDLDVDVTDSFNDNSTNDSNNDNRDYDDSFNDNRDYDDSFNDEREYDDSFNTDIDDSYNSDSSTNDSNNDNSDHSTTDIKVALSLQNLEASVSGFEFDVGGSHHKAGELKTGDISNSGGAFAGFAGIQTATYNTGFAATNQAATAISANANVTFGNGG